MQRAITTQLHAHDRTIFWTIFGVGVLSLACYFYFLSISVVAVISRKETEIEIGRVATRVALLESQYAALDRNIDLAVAHERGFVDVLTPRYVRHDEEGVTLTLRTLGD